VESFEGVLFETLFHQHFKLLQFMQKKDASCKKPFEKVPLYYTVTTMIRLLQRVNSIGFMRVSACIVLCLAVSAQMLVASPGRGQSMKEKEIALQLRNESLANALDKIGRLSGFRIGYSPNQVDKYKGITLEKDNRTVEKTVQLVLAGTNLSFKQQADFILIFSKQLGEDNLTAIHPTEQDAERIPIKGNITDENGRPLPGASIQLKGSNIGTATKVNGDFELNVPVAEGVLLVSYIGYTPMEVKIDGGTTFLKIALIPSASQTAEVVVVGYGTQKKINLTGAVTSINAEKLENRGVANISNIIAGQAPGVTVLQRGGPPGRDGGSLSIRGIGTLGNANPLIIVDGIETDDYSQINPNDIASISILKDASSAAIYGINGANGVIIITTKRGVKGKLKMNYDFQAGGSAFSKLPQKVDAYNLAVLYNEAQSNDGTPESGLKFSSSDLQKFKDGSSPLTHANTDWVDAIFSRRGTWLSHNLTLSGGTEDTKYSVSLGYLDQDGIMANTGYKRYNFRTNFDQRISDRFTTGFNLSLSVRDVNDPPTVLGVGGETWYLHQAFQQWATDPVSYPDGRWAYPIWSGLNHNPVAYSSPANGYSKNNDTRLIGTGFAEYKIIDGLSIKGIAANTRDYNYSSNLGLGVDLYPIDPTTGNISTVPNNNSASMPAVTSTRSVSRGFFRHNDLNLQALINYEKKLGRHDLKLLAGYTQRQITDEVESITRINLSDPSLTQIDAADPANQTTAGNKTAFRSRSMFGRLNYVYADKYLFEANLRNDATSRFAPDNRTAVFPSFAVGWVISNESFFKVATVSNLKIRASWGKLGNQEIGNYRYLSTYSLGSFYIFDGTRYSGINEGALANRSISWETTESRNLGLDLGLWNNHFSVSADLFVRETKDILLALKQPAFLGAAPPVANAGAVRNKGFEITMGYKNTIGKLGYYVNANVAKVKNEITNLAGTETPELGIGDPINNIFGYEAEGLFQNQEQINKHADQSAIGTPKPGDIMYKDRDGDGFVTAADRTSLGSFFPQVNYGISFGANYNGFDISTLWQGVAKVKALLNGRLVQPFGTFGSSPIVDQLDRWTVDGKNPDARFPRESFNASHNYVNSSWWVFNTSFLKLRNIQLGYTLPAALAAKIRIAKARIYVSGENLLTISPFKIMDPESITIGDPFFGYDGSGAYPTTKRILAGISLTF
jgi:TonB-linked SusC/RagA family outer membrane protein